MTKGDWDEASSILEFLHVTSAESDWWLDALGEEILPTLYKVYQEVLGSFRAGDAAKKALTISSSLQKDVPALRLLSNILKISVDASELMPALGEKHLPDFVRAAGAILIGSTFLPDAKHGGVPDEDAVNMCDALRRNASFSLFAIVERLPCCLPAAANIMRSRHPNLLVAIQGAPDISIQRMLVRFLKLLYDHISKSPDKNASQFVEDMDRFLRDIQDGSSLKRAKLALSCFHSIDFDSAEEWALVERFRKLLCLEVWDDDSPASKCVTIESCYVLLQESKSSTLCDGYEKARIDFNLRNVSIKSEKHNEPLRFSFRQMKDPQLTKDGSELRFKLTGSGPCLSVAIKFSSKSARVLFLNEILPRLDREQLLLPKVDQMSPEGPPCEKKSVAELRTPIRQAKAQILPFSASEVKAYPGTQERSKEVNDTPIEEVDAFSGLATDGVILLTGLSTECGLPSSGRPTNIESGSMESRRILDQLPQEEGEVAVGTIDSEFCGNTQEKLSPAEDKSPAVAEEMIERKVLDFCDDGRSESGLNGGSLAESAESSVTVEESEKTLATSRSKRKRAAPRKVIESSEDEQLDAREDAEQDARKDAEMKSRDDVLVLENEKSEDFGCGLSLSGWPTNEESDPKESRRELDQLTLAEGKAAAGVIDSEFCGNTQEISSQATGKSPARTEEITNHEEITERKELDFSDDGRTVSRLNGGSQSKSAESSEIAKEPKRTPATRRSKRKRAAPRRFIEFSRDEDQDAREGAEMKSRGDVENEKSENGESDEDDQVEVGTMNNDADACERETKSENDNNDSDPEIEGEKVILENSETASGEGNETEADDMNDDADAPEREMAADNEENDIDAEIEEQDSNFEESEESCDENVEEDYELEDETEDSERDCEVSLTLEGGEDLDEEMSFESEGEIEKGGDLDAEDEECDDAGEGDSDREEEEILERIGLILSSVLAKRKERSARLLSDSRSAILSLEERTADADKQAAVSLKSDIAKLGAVQLGRISKVQKKYHTAAQGLKAPLSHCRSSSVKMGKDTSRKVAAQRKAVKGATDGMKEVGPRLKSEFDGHLLKLKKNKAKKVGKSHAVVARLSNFMDDAI